MHSNKLCSSAGYQLAFHTLDHRKARSICHAARSAIFGCEVGDCHSNQGLRPPSGCLQEATRLLAGSDFCTASSEFSASAEHRHG